MRTTGYFREALVNWHSFCKEVCTLVLSAQPKFIGTDTQWYQVDEALFLEKGRIKNAIWWKVIRKILMRKKHQMRKCKIQVIMMR